MPIGNMGLRIFKDGVWSGTISGNDGQMTGEKIPGDLANWSALSTDPNDIVNTTYGLLQKRSSTLYHTYAPVSSAINKQTTYAIGSGLLFRSQPDSSILNMDIKQAKDWGKRFQKLFHYFCQEINFYEKQSILFRGAEVLGDSLLFFDRKQENFFDLIEVGGDNIDYLAEGDNVTLGIKHDDLLRKTGIITKSNKKIDFVDSNGDQNVVQLMFKELPRQLRGYSLAYKVINLAKNHDRFNDATVQRAVLETIMFGYSQTGATDISKQVANVAKASRSMKSNTSASTSIINKIGNAFGLGGGNIFQLKTGEDLKFTELQTPANNFDKFNEAEIDLVGAATGTPPEVILSKYNTSYTAHKGAFNDFIKTYMMKRKLFTNVVGYPVLKEFAKYAILNGMISAPGFFENSIMQRAYLGGNWLGTVPGAINPLQEVNARIKKVEAGFMLRSDAAAEEGNEFDNIIEEYAEEEQKFYQSNPEKRAEMLAADLKNNKGENV